MRSLSGPASQDCKRSTVANTVVVDTVFPQCGETVGTAEVHGEGDLKSIVVQFRNAT
jgi:hypothetical protein